MSTSSVTVKSTGKGKFQQTIDAGGHILTADEPAALGGNGGGPAPYEFLMAALGACTSMTLRMYADRKNWPLEGVEVFLSHEKTKDAQGNEGAADKFSREIVLLGGGLTDEQRARLIEIANKCPVHKTLQNAALIETRERKNPAPAP